MNKKERILELYYEKNQKQQDIAQMVKVSQSYVSQVIKADKRYNFNRETKHKASMLKKKNYNKEYYKTYKRPKKKDNSYQEMQAQLNKDTTELSFYSGYNISDYDFAKWNLSAYHRDKNGNLAIDKKLKVSNDVPRKINMNIKVKPQRCLV